MIGSRLGSYTIKERLGSGGMGIVYLAHDAHLKRDVALKLLHDDLAMDPAGHERLLEEARSASALNHPNICTIYDVKEADGRQFITMEYVEGTPLAGVVPEGGLSEELVLSYGIQIADALDHAHERNIVHRDLKSANVIITPNGRAKILDFGLALHIPQRALEELTRSRTETMRPGFVAGTLHYLAPEILEGRQASRRSDLWALGVILYEIATSSYPFRGQTGYDISSSILREAPAPLPLQISAGLKTVILHCLAKSPGQRYRRAGEVQAALEAVYSDASAHPVTSFTPVRVRNLRLLLAAVVLAGIAAVTILVSRGPAPTTEPGSTTAKSRLTLLMAPEGRVEDPAISPDGTTLAYVAYEGERADIFVRRIQGAQPIRVTDDANTESRPTFSPDGERIAFARVVSGQLESEVCLVSVFGGDTRSVIKRASAPAWSPDGQRFAFVYHTESGQNALAIQSILGGELQVVLAPAVDYPFLYSPAWSPDGRMLAVGRSSGGGAREIWVIPIEAGPARPLHVQAPGIYSDHPVFTPDSRFIIHASNRSGARNLWMTPVDGGPSTRLTSGPGPDKFPSVAASGEIVFLNARARCTLGRFTLATGQSDVLLSHAQNLWAPVVSPDGRSISYSQSEADGSWAIWTCSSDGSNAHPVASEQIPQIHSRFSPDGSKLVYYTWTTEADRIWSIPVEGGRPIALTPERATDDLHPDLSPDGLNLAFTRTDEDGAWISIAPVEGGPATRITQGEIPRWSPDGKWLAFSLDRGYVNGIYLVAPDGGEPRQLTSTGGWPEWWPDGSRVGYLVVGDDGNQQIWTVDLEGGEPQRLNSPVFNGYNYPFDVTPDGKSIVYTNRAHVSNEVWLLEPEPSR